MFVLKRANVIPLFQPVPVIQKINLTKEVCINFFIPSNEITYWKELVNFGTKLIKASVNKNNQLYNDTQQSLNEFYSELIMFDEMNFPLDNLSFFISIFDIYLGYIIMQEFMKSNKSYRKENQFYYERMLYILNQHKEMFELLKESFS